jgi:hypothetical protein
MTRTQQDRAEVVAGALVIGAVLVAAWIVLEFMG